jgi:PAS domain S-box-containing protein
MAESLKLFLVEDDDDFSYLMRKSLERAGHHVSVCHSGADALIVLSHTNFQLVLLDQKLPDMSGLDLLQALHREAIATPVLMVTGFGDEQLAAQVLRAGALDYVVKDRALTFLTDLPKRVHESITRYRLQQSNNLLIAALESARDGIMITDLQGNIQHVNQALEKMFGHDRQELIGQNPRIFRSGVHSQEFFGNLWHSIMNRVSWQGELVNKRKDGTLLDSSLTVSPIVNGQGQLTHFVGIFRDVSEHKQMERQLFQAQKMQSVGTLAGGVAHEFNNLLAGIQGYASLALRDSSVQPAVRQFLDYIVQLSDRAANLTRQLLAFARKPALSRQATSMEQLLIQTVTLIRHTLKMEVRVEILQNSVHGEPLMALADSNQLQQVLVNLALNARDATPSKANSCVEFRLRHQMLNSDLPAFPQNVPPGDYAILEVEDHGTGMSQQVLQQALDPFFTTKDVGQGTGLGLPVAFGIILGHQGFLTIDTRIHLGTCVRLYLPRLGRVAMPPVAKTFDTPEVLDLEPQQNCNILVIDDEQAVTDIIRRFLEIAGHQVTCVASAAAGVEVLKQNGTMDLIILDLMIPKEEGKQNIQRLRQCAPHLPILLCTGMLKPDEAGQLLEQGNIDTLRKPFRMNELWYMVNKSLGSR